MPEDFWILFIWSIIIGLAAAGITVGIIVAKYKKKLKAPIYPIDRYASLSLTAHSDEFLSSNVTRVRVSSSKSRRR